jgi:anti-anti-sigma regulatory factor
MFRISAADDAGTRVLRLEGALTSEAIPLLEESVADARDRALRLDLSGLTWLDDRAAARLHALRAQGASLTACSPFLTRLLALNER